MSLHDIYKQQKLTLIHFHEKIQKKIDEGYSKG